MATSHVSISGGVQALSNAIAVAIQQATTASNPSIVATGGTASVQATVPLSNSDDQPGPAQRYKDLSYMCVLPFVRFCLMFLRQNWVYYEWINNLNT